MPFTSIDIAEMVLYLFVRTIFKMVARLDVARGGVDRCANLESELHINLNHIYKHSSQ